MHPSAPLRSSIISPTTNQRAKTAIQEIEKKLSTLRSQALKADAQLDPIDWSKYSKSIKAKGVVDQLKKQYEAQIQELPVGDVKPPFLDKVNSTLDQNIAGAERSAKVSAEEVKKLEQQLTKAEKNKTDRPNWNLQRWYEEYPGLEEQHQKEFMEGTYLLPERIQRIANVDVNELRRSYETGTRMSFPELEDAFGNDKLTDRIKELKELEAKLNEGTGYKPRDLAVNIYVDENPNDAINPDYKPHDEHH